MILDEILANTRRQLAVRQRLVPVEELQRRVAEAEPVRGFRAALADDGISLVAEVKRRSPSRGDLAADVDAAVWARTYQEAGAAAVSVLTDESYFGGTLVDLQAARRATTLPLLRKDFMVDPYQVWEARGAGADAILLIAAALGDGEMTELEALASRLGMDVLVEAHTAPELERALELETGLVGINNRDLQTFQVSLEHTLELAPMVPADVVLVSESGIRAAADLTALRAAGVRAVLVGETLMRSPDPGTAVRELVDG